MVKIINFNKVNNGEINVFNLLDNLKPRESLRSKYSLKDIYGENIENVLDDLEHLFRNYKVSEDLHVEKNNYIKKLKKEISTSKQESIEID